MNEWVSGVDDNHYNDNNDDDEEEKTFVTDDIISGGGVRLAGATVAIIMILYKFYIV